MVVLAVILTDELTHGLRRLETEAVIDTVNPHLAANSILTSHLALIEVVEPVDRLRILILLPAPAHVPVPRLVDTATNAPVVPASADPDPPFGETAEKRGDAARTMVIETDPLPAKNHPAHVLPEETEADRVLSPAA